MEKILESKDYRFYVVGLNEKEMREAFQRLRYEVFVRGMKCESERPEQLEWEKFDTNSDYIIGIDKDNNVMAGCRIIPFTIEHGLPISKAKLNKELHPRSVEISRLIAPNPAVKRVLYALSYRYTLERKYKYIYALARKGVAKKLCEEGIDSFEIIGETFYHKKLQLVPIVVDLDTPSSRMFSSKILSNIK